MRLAPIAITLLLVLLGPPRPLPIRQPLRAGHDTAPAAAAADTASPESIVAALYDVISGPAGQARDWARFRALFADSARLIPAAPQSDAAAPRVLTPEDYVQRTSDVVHEERVLRARSGAALGGFGTIAHVFSTSQVGGAPRTTRHRWRADQLIQLMRHANRWWVVSVMWDQERTDNPIPPDYVRSAPGR